MAITVGASGANKNANAISVGAGGAWKAVVKISVGAGGVWKEAWVGLQSLLASVLSGLTTTSSPTDATCTFTMLSGGSYTLSGTAGGTWKNGGVGADYECRFTVTSGSVSSGTTGSWLSLSSDRTWTKTNPNNVISLLSVSGTFEVRAASSGTVLSTTTLTLDAEVV